MAEQNAVEKWFTGKKTYAISLAIIACGILTWQGIAIPEYVWASLAALGLGFLRAGVDNANS